MFAKLDHWIGTNLFIPPIIKFCQITRQSQFAVSRLFWFIAALDGFYHAETTFSMVLWGGVSVIMMITASRRADHPTASFMFFRLLAMVFLLLDLLRSAVTNEWGGSEFWLFVLIAEYATTIRQVPPRETGRAAVKRPAQG